MSHSFPVWLAVLLLLGLGTMKAELKCVPLSFALQPQALPLVGLLHGMVMHLPAMWSNTVHASRAIELFERMVYSHLLHLVVLTSLQWNAPWIESTGVWTMAVYCQMQAAWSVCRAARVPRATLSSGLLQLSMVASATVSAYVLLRGACFASPPDNRFYMEHLLALLGAHLCSLFVQLLG